jgi:hypothetical protein
MVAAGLMRPTTPLETMPPEPIASLEEPVDPGEEQGGSAEAKPTTKARRKRPLVASKTTGRKLVLPDDVHDRLWLLARQRRQTVSAVATEILDRNLPRFTVSREG